MSQITLDRIKKALKTLDEGYTPNPDSLSRDGIIQRFEYCFELCWKTSKKILFESGINSDTPKDVIRECAKVGWLESPEIWFEFLKARNLTSHIYNEDVATEIFNIIQKFMEESKKLLKALNENLR